MITTITTKQLAKELGRTQRSIQNRIMRLLARGEITHVQRAGVAFILTSKQANLVRNYSAKKVNATEPETILVRLRGLS